MLHQLLKNRQGLGGAAAHRLPAHDRQLQHHPIGLVLHIGKQLHALLLATHAHHRTQVGNGLVIHLRLQRLQHRLQRLNQGPRLHH